MKQSEKQEESEVGLVCTNCGCKHFTVVYTRPSTNNRIMRRRECRYCGKRILTYETTR